MIEEILPGYIRISDVLKPFSKFDHINPDVLKNAADRGTRVHDFCNSYANNIFIGDVDEDCKGYVHSFIEWYDENVESLIHSEKRLYDPFLMITGKFDMIVKLKDSQELTLLDIKTPSSVSKMWGLQLSVYSHLIKHDLRISIGKKMILQLPKDGKKSKQIFYPETEKYFKLFLYALSIYEYINQK